MSPHEKNILHKLMIAAFFQSTSESFWKSSPAQKPSRALVKLLHTSKIILFLLNFFRRISSDMWLWRWQKFFNIFSAWCVSLFHHRSKLENIIKGGTFVKSKVAPCFLISFPTGGFQCNEPLSVGQWKLSRKWKEVMACNVSPVAMLNSCFLLIHLKPDVRQIWYL